MNDVQVFAFGNNLVRTVQKGGEPWWIARDVCAVLGLDVNHGARSLDDDEKGLQIVETPGGPQEVTVISEPGLYSLILRSRKPEARQFRRWITHEVIPAIRRTGAYEANNKKLTALLERYGDSMTAEARSRLVLAIAGVSGGTAPAYPYPYSSPLTADALEGVRQFINEVYPDRPVKVATRDLYERYEKWCSKYHVAALPSKNSFAHAMGKLGYKRALHYSGSGVVLKGWLLEPEEMRQTA